jgi:RNA polymerase sigma-70 factor (ECF subfamily)
MGSVTGSPYVPGSEADFDRLYRDSYPRILATLRGMLGDLADAEDCAQDTFVSAYRAWRTWKPDAPAEAWLHRIAVNTAISLRRRARLRQPVELVRRLGKPAPPPDPTEDETSTLLAALRRLTPEQAAIVVLRHLHGYSNREIAVAIGAPESTVSSRLVTAKARLVAELASLGVEPPPAGFVDRTLSGVSTGEMSTSTTEATEPG